MKNGKKRYPIGQEIYVIVKAESIGKRFWDILKRKKSDYKGAQFKIKF